MTYRKVCFSLAEKQEQQILAGMDSKKLEHRIEIVSHGREYSIVDLHKEALLSTKIVQRPTVKHTVSKRKQMF